MNGFCQPPHHRPSVITAWTVQRCVEGDLLLREFLEYLQVISTPRTGTLGKHVPDIRTPGRSPHLHEAIYFAQRRFVAFFAVFLAAFLP